MTRQTSASGGGRPGGPRRILVAGLGDAGCNAVRHLAPRLAGRAEVVLFNTDSRALASAGDCRHVQLGMHVTNGLGAGGNPNMGRRAADAELPAIRDALAGAGFVVLVAGLGGGTGSGAAPLLAQEARRAGARVLGVAILPFEFEGKRRAEQAERGLRALRDAADVVVCLPNQRLFEIAGSQAGVARAYEVSHDLLGASLLGLIRVLEDRGVITLDFSDFCSLLEGAAGSAVLASAEGGGPAAVEDVLQTVQDHPLLLKGQALAKASAILVSVLAGPGLTLGHLDRLLSGIHALAGKETVVAVGLASEESWTDRLLVTFLVVERVVAGRTTAGPVRAVAVMPRDQDREPATHAPRVARPAPEKVTQAGLFDELQSSPGRFKNVEPTIHEGHNLDIPTFRRRGIEIQKPQPAGKV
jgi:cell division protein FtsZ